MLTAMIVVLLILLVVCVFLAIPVGFAFDVQYGDGGKDDVALVLLFGLVRIPLTGLSGMKWPEKADNYRKKKTKRRGQTMGFALLRNAHFRGRLVKVFHSLLYAIKIKNFDLKLRLGLNDPADTGRLYGILGPLSSQLSGNHNVSIRVDPEFAAEVFALQSHGRITFTPLRVLSISLYFFLSPEVIRALVLSFMTSVRESFIVIIT